MTGESRNERAEPVPVDPTRAFRKIAKTWEAFVGTNGLTGTLPRPVIAQRWQHCRELGIDPFLQRAPTVLMPEEVDAILAREDLGRAGRQVLDDFSATVEGTGHVILLADALGRVIYSAGHAPIRQTLDRLNLAPGAGWAESAVGPNGIGTPIALGRPETVFGPEHYCQPFQPWVCYGSPIREPETGRIVGGVDITGPARKAQRLAFVLTVSIARSIEQSLAVLGLSRQQALLAAFRGLERRWPTEGILVVSEAGRVIEMNGAAADALGYGSLATPPSSLAEIAPDLWASVRKAVTNGTGCEEHVALRTAAGPPRSMLCRVEPLTREGRLLGSVIVLSPRTGVPAVGRRPSARTRPEADAPTVKYSFADFLGEAPPLREALDLARAAAAAAHEKPILLGGESGTGKELMAHAIHGAGRRAGGPFVAVNCGALPAELIESELFGYAPGAFTGARREGHLGWFEMARGGTLFLDEIDSVPVELQGKFLRALEDGEVVRLGSARAVRVDARVVAASSVELAQRVREGRFRLDLYHRLGVVEIVLPPLRARGADVLLLARAFLERECTEAGRSPLAITPGVAECLLRYEWPGNVRELQNLCTRWALTVRGSEIEPEHVPRHLRAGRVGEEPPVGSLREAQDALIEQTLRDAGGDVAGAARRLGIAKTTLYRRLRRRKGAS
jgi:sigma-54 dependent transcriptional regulator, acetoin dehydrogenase operon transcriptional activator AcoR